MSLLRRSEWVLVAYFAYATVLADLLPVPGGVAKVTLLVNVAVVAGLFLLAWVDSLRRRRFLGTVRDWFPPPLLLLAYREMGWFAPATHSFRLEREWVLWDRWFLNDLGARAVIESLGPVLPSVLEVSYSLVYAIPYFSLALLTATGRRDQIDRFLFPFALAVLSAYALFPYFPSEPPRTVFPGDNLPTWNTVFRRFNLGLLGGYGIHTSVFPSAHVSGAFSAALAMRRVLPEKPWAGRFLLVLAVSIATATVYGRYHYLVDALAGLGIALVAMLTATSRRSKP